MRLTAEGKTLFLWLRGFGPDGPQPPATGEGFKLFVSGVRGYRLVRHSNKCNAGGHRTDKNPKAQCEKASKSKSTIFNPRKQAEIQTRQGKLNQARGRPGIGGA